MSLADLPNGTSGQPFDYPIPFTGGAGGPYHLDVIDGALPKGVTTDDEAVALVGRPLEDGPFPFTLKLIDLGSSPATTSIAVVEWFVDVGGLVIVTDPDLPSWVFNQFASVDLLVAGGEAPYACEVIDDPANPFDQPLPVGLAIPPFSTTIAGAPVVPSADTVRVTIRARDQADDPFAVNVLTVTKEFRITVLIPDLVLVSTTVPDGECGVGYSAHIETLDGIPPFRHRIVDPATVPGAGVDLSLVMLRGEPGTPGGLVKGTGLSAYLQNDDDGAAGVYTGLFPEGLVMRSSGDITGIPRRVGDFQNWRYYVQSTALPNAVNQNRSRTFSFRMLPSTGGPVALVPGAAILQPGQGYTAPTNLIKPPELGRPYSESVEASGGVVQDGKLDAPHDDQQVDNPAEQAGKHAVVATFGSGFVPADYGMSFDAWGLFEGTPTRRTSSLVNLGLLVTDAQLPLPAGPGHSTTGNVRFEIGPDFVVVTETLSTTNNTSTVNVDVSYAYPRQTMEVYEAYSTGPTIRKVAAGDFVVAQDSATPTVARQLNALQADGFSEVNFLTCTVNPTWWAYDGFNVNPRAARAGQNADPERRSMANAMGGDGFGMKAHSTSVANIVGYSDGFEHGSNLAVDLPYAQGVAHDPNGTGVYADGGMLYAYSREPSAGTGEFGFLILRKDARVYVPYSENRTATRDGFGDGWVSKSNTVTPALQKPQITVSPDGRFAAAKVKASVQTWGETASVSKVVLFSLTGQKIAGWGNKTFVVIDTGSNGTTSLGKFLYADSLTLTNKYLYFLTGNFGDTLANAWQATYLEHYIWRYEITAGASAAALLSGPAADADWTNSSGSPMSTAFHAWFTPGATSHPSPVYNNYLVTEGTNNGAVASTPVSPSPDFQVYHWANFNESSQAPHPFRVSADGRACAIVAASLPAGTTSGVNLQNYVLYVDYDTATSVRRVSAPGRRHFRGAHRGGLAIGQQTRRLYGWYDGPGTQLEISDDGRKIAAVYNTSVASWTAANVYAGSSSAVNTNQAAAREDLVVYFAPAVGSDPWNGVVAAGEVTANIWLAPVGQTYFWRFGCLAFSQDAGAVVFWAGLTMEFQTNPSFGSVQGQEASNQSGTLCRATLSSSAVTARGSILAFGDGGSINGVLDYTLASPCQITAGTWTTNFGAVSPTGCFYSPNREFFYVHCAGALVSGQTASRRLLGVNVGTNTYITGRGPLQAFTPAWTGIMANRGIVAQGYLYPYGGYTFMYGMGHASSSIGGMKSSSDGASLATDGKLWFANYNITTSGSRTSTTSRSSTGVMGGPVYSSSYDYGSYNAMVTGIETNVGGDPFVQVSPGGSSQRTVPYIQPSADGNTVAIVVSEWDTSSFPTTYYAHHGNKERLVVVRGISLNYSASAPGWGQMNPGAAAYSVEGANGRVSTAVQFGANQALLYYGYVSGASSESSMMLKTAALGTAAATNVATQGGLLAAGGGARFAVLMAGRW